MTIKPISFKRKIISLLLFSFGFILILFIALNIIFPLKVNIKYSQVIRSSDGTILHAFLSDDEKWRMITSASDISEAFKKVILFKEDRFFYYHPGINPVAIARALFNNTLKNQRTSGASTITMQLARLLYPQARTYLNKILDMFHALQLEIKYSKEDILRMYLTLVPYGGNIEGINAASYFYFNTPANKLSLSQITALCVIPNRPNSLRPGRNNFLLLNARNKWLNKFTNTGLFQADEISSASHEPLTSGRNKLTDLAHHFSLLMHRKFSEQPEVRTSLDLRLQQKLENIVSNYSERLKSININNAAVLVINNKTHSVAGYLGSADNNDSLNAGQVDGVQAVRSPGSTLKPAIYAMSFDMGLFTPKSKISDVPVNYDGYSPENYNSTYNGDVTVEHALSNSLNIPAVKTLELVGIRSFTSKLEQAGFRQIAKDNSRLGLAAALGGCGVTLFELTALYSSFASGGIYSSPSFIPVNSYINFSKLFSASSGYMITDILSRPTRSDLPSNYSSSMHVPKIAWKTGTSYGRRDAWSIGYNSDYTVGVWLGNFSGEGVPELSGAEMATPLLFELFNSIDYNSRNNWFAEPADLDIRLVCSESGKPPSDFCENQVIDYYIPGVSSNQKCDHEKLVYLSPDEHFSYCTSCLPPNGYKEKYLPNISSDLISFYESEHIAYSKIPVHNPKCSRILHSGDPVITSPLNNKEYLITRNDSDQQILLSCKTGNQVQKIFWYINDQFYTSSQSNKDVFFNPQKGKYKISCSDDKGRNCNIYILISYI